MTLVVGRVGCLYPGDLIHASWLAGGALRHGWAHVIAVDGGTVTLAPQDAPAVIVTMGVDAPVVVAP